jgi:CubicO group peptidase (beta-lactamase class C family)
VGGRAGAPVQAHQYSASNITIRHLLHMVSGVTDYDTNAFRHLQFAHPKVDFSPLDLLDYVHAPLMFPPGGTVNMTLNYCSINYILLGLIAAHLDGVHDWRAWNQSAVLPRSVSGVRFVSNGTCGKYTAPLQAYDRTDVQPIDVSSISCLGGWSAGNVVMSAPSAANWTYALYGAASEVLPPKTVAQMLPNRSKGDTYGLATFDFTGQYANGTNGVAHGHLGDTCTRLPPPTHEPSTLHSSSREQLAHATLRERVDALLRLPTSSLPPRPISSRQATAALARDISRRVLRRRFVRRRLHKHRDILPSQGRRDGRRD